MLINDAKIGRLYYNVKYCWTMLNTDGKMGNLFENVEHSWTMLNTDEKCVKLLNTVGQFLNTIHYIGVTRVYDFKEF